MPLMAFLVNQGKMRIWISFSVKEYPDEYLILVDIDVGV